MFYRLFKKKNTKYVKMIVSITTSNTVQRLIYLAMLILGMVKNTITEFKYDPSHTKCPAQLNGIN